jgi:hypothetical protein
MGIIRAAVIGAAAVGIALVGGPAAQAPVIPGTRTIAMKAYVCEQLGECSVAPRQISFSANNDLIGSGLKWTGWGRSTTTGRGSIRVNWDGNPKIRKGSVKLYNLRKCGGALAYRSGTVKWPGQSVKVTFDCVSDYGPTSLVPFRSQSGKLGCYLSWDAEYGSAARCDVRSPKYSTPVLPSCEDLEQGDSLYLAKVVSSTCHGDTALGAQRVLKHGNGLRLGDHQCTMTATRVTCRNLVTKHGFWMSQGSYDIW